MKVHDYIRSLQNKTFDYGRGIALKEIKRICSKTFWERKASPKFRMVTVKEIKEMETPKA